MEKPSAYSFPSDSDEFLPLTPPPVHLCPTSHPSSSQSLTAPAPPADPASTQPSARQAHGSKRGSASQPQLLYKDWTTPKLLKDLFEKSIPIPVGGDRMALFLIYCEALSANSLPPPTHPQACAVRSSSSATLAAPIPAAHSQDTAHAALSPHLDKLENPTSSAPPAFSSSSTCLQFQPILSKKKILHYFGYDGGIVLYGVFINVSKSFMGHLESSLRVQVAQLIKDALVIIDFCALFVKSKLY
ncbi:hypothetical protein EOD39_11778 [Acipenser ruthenus]|uniref:Uncharacterized protein n=1 Tax=Acipenser ruthenus TaxID=7906 RepID=A0A662YRP6_ACIRT|nr:hypothetical protein EOD39_11778 [Acipenser ruthenus]